MEGPRRNRPARWRVEPARGESHASSPVRGVIRKLVREVLVEYPFDVMYFDGPYQDMQNAKSY